MGRSHYRCVFRRHGLRSELRHKHRDIPNICRANTNEDKPRWQWNARGASICRILCFKSSASRRCAGCRKPTRLGVLVSSSAASLIRASSEAANLEFGRKAIELPTTQSYTPAVQSAFRDCADILQCPAIGEPLVEVEDGWRSASGQRNYPVEHGIPRLFAPVDPTTSDRDVTDMVKAFCEETPFPNYDDIDSRETLVTKARQGRFAAALDEQLPEGAIVLEAGFGTGQLTNFLGLS